jgi:tRNA pseudouridine38-40 synthase
MGRIAMKIAYDGGAFHGQARQPGLSTVEGEILIALARARIIGDARSSRFQSASRTDQGVSALGNVVAFDTAMASPAVLRAFNSKARGVWAWAAANVSPDFNARRAVVRWYRYMLPKGHNPERLAEILAPFVGEHDFRNFTRDRTRTVATIEIASAAREGDEIALDFCAPSFRWNLIRRIVAAALQVEGGTRSRADVERALAGSKRIDFGLAPPEPLTLMDVQYDVPLEPIMDLTTRDRVRRLLEERARSARFANAVARKFDSPNL